MSVNKVILVGHCCKDAEIRYMPNGDAVTNISIATNEKWKDKNGEKQEKTEFHNLVFFKRLAEVAGEYLKKGAQIYVEGKITTEKWTDKESAVRYSTKIIVNEMQMLGGKHEEKRAEKPVETYDGGLRKDAPQESKSSFDNFDDDIPF